MKLVLKKILQIQSPNIHVYMWGVEGRTPGALWESQFFSQPMVPWVTYTP